MRVKSQKLIGTDNIKLGHVSVVMGRTTMVTDDDEVVETLAIFDDSLWEQFHLR